MAQATTTTAQPKRPRGRPRKPEDQRAADRAAKTIARRERRRALRAMAVRARQDALRAPSLEKERERPDHFVPTAEDRQRVQVFAGLGTRHDEIALMVINPATGLPIDAKTLEQHFQRELETGPVLANSQVAQSLLKKATGNGSQSVTAAIWWSKVRMGWSERIAVEVEVKSGVLVAPAKTSAEEWIAEAAARGAAQLAEAKGGAR